MEAKFKPPARYVGGLFVLSMRRYAGVFSSCISDGKRAARLGARAFLYDFTFASVPFMSRSMFER